MSKNFEAVVDGGALAADAVLRFEQGMTLRDGTEYRRQTGNPRDRAGAARACDSKEGKYHQVKRMIAAVSGTVTALKRLRLGWSGWINITPANFGNDTGELEKLTSANLKNLKITIFGCTFYYLSAGHVI